MSEPPLDRAQLGLDRGRRLLPWVLTAAVAAVGLTVMVPALRATARIEDHPSAQEASELPRRRVEPPTRQRRKGDRAAHRRAVAPSPSAPLALPAGPPEASEHLPLPGAQPAGPSEASEHLPLPGAQPEEPRTLSPPSPEPSAAEPSPSQPPLLGVETEGGAQHAEVPELDGPVTLDGNGEQIARAIALAKRTAVQHCFEQQLKREPNLKGVVNVELDLSAPAQVDGVRVSDDLQRPELTRCIAATMQRLSFTGLNEDISVRVPYVLTARSK